MCIRIKEKVLQPLSPDKFSLFFAFDKKKTDSYVMDYYLARPTSAGAATPVSGAKKVPYYTGGYAYEVGDKGELHWDENTYTVNFNWDVTDSSYLKLNALYSQYTVEPFDSTSYLRDSDGNEVRSGGATL